MCTFPAESVTPLAAERYFGLFPGRTRGDGRVRFAGAVQKRAQEIDQYQVTIDLEKREVRDEQGFRAQFAMDEFVRHCLLNGLDDIGLTLQYEKDIAEYEAQHPAPAALAVESDPTD